MPTGSFLRLNLHVCQCCLLLLNLPLLYLLYSKPSQPAFLLLFLDFVSSKPKKLGNTGIDKKWA